jgi:hypothetical protein
MRRVRQYYCENKNCQIMSPESLTKPPCRFGFMLITIQYFYKFMKKIDPIAVGYPFSFFIKKRPNVSQWGLIHRCIIRQH